MEKQKVKWTESQKYIQISRYSRWRDELGRRETWDESVDRYLNFMKERFEAKAPKRVFLKVEKAIKDLETMPSMRAAWAAGPALAENNILAYNCAYLPIIDIRAFVEVFYILMCGTGVGTSVEAEYISQLPVIQPYSGYGVGTHVVGDSREGWADSLKAGLEAWFNGWDIDFDYSKVRPKGARLVKMGGRASGPDPLKELHAFARKLITSAGGRKLTPIECLDLVNMIGEVVVVGGIRRASEIVFSDLNDTDLRDAKIWPYPIHRKNSNNTATYKCKPTMVEFMEEWSALAKSGTGERGIFNLEAVKAHIPKRRKWTDDFRTNPCGEIQLRPFEFCNLSEIVVRAEDEFDDLVQKAEAAVWLGAMQSCLTDFPYIRPEWKKNCEEERLLGVSLTGQMDNPALLTPERLSDLKKYVLKVAKRAAEALGINFSVSVTTGKPSGTVSQLVNSASGCHARFARWYIRRYRMAANDPLFAMMRDQGVAFFPEVGQENLPEDKVTTWVCEFPIASPEGCITKDDLSAIDQLEWYAKIQENWCEHNQSCTIYIKDEEWLEVGAWVYKNWDKVNGLSFLPADGGSYKLAPYQSITQEEYKKMAAAFPEIDYNLLMIYEQEDSTEGSKTLACVGGSCEI